jgi:hypothetical protein
VIFSCGTGEKFPLHVVLLGLWYNIYNIPSPMVDILSLWSPHKLLKNLGALSKYAKCSQSSTNIKKNMKSLLSILDTTKYLYI